MAWSGKVLGGLLGGMVGGPLGVGVGAALGHYLADGEGAAKGRELVVARVLFRHHAFGPSGPGARVTPVWRARSHEGRDVRVRIEAGPYRYAETVVPDADDELCELPEVLVPYAGWDGGVRVRLESARTRADVGDFDIELPSRVRRSGSSGPARVVMALVACARAGGRELSKGDVRFIRESFTAAHPLDGVGLEWLRGWMRELRDADAERLSPEKVAKRLAKHVGIAAGGGEGAEGGEAGAGRSDAAGDARRGAPDGTPEAVEEVLLWLMRGAREAWPGPAAEAWVARFGDALGVDAAEIAALWRELDTGADDDARERARAVLGVGDDAPPEEIRAAWLQLVQAWHPDRAQGDAAVAEATRRVAEINAAWRVLRGG